MTGERLAFGVTVILAVTMNSVVASAMMPVTSATILMDYINMICLLFSILSLVETGLVLNLYHRTDRNWFHALMPIGGYKVYREFIRKVRLYRTPSSARPASVPEVEVPHNHKGIFRLQLYREIFFSLDKNHSGELEFMEVEAFALSVLGYHEEGAQARNEVLDKVDLGSNGRINFDEFAAFCEQNIEEKDDIRHLTKMLRGYVRAIDREAVAIKEMWKRRAIMVDTVCRIAIPLGFVVSLIYIFSLDEKSLEDVETDRKAQWLMQTSGFWIVAACLLVYFFYVVFRCVTKTRKKNSMTPGDHGIKHAFKPVGPAGQPQELKRAPSARNLKCPPQATDIDRMLKEELEEQKKVAEKSAQKDSAAEKNREHDDEEEEELED
jgi:hypothetical protein